MLLLACILSFLRAMVRSAVAFARLRTHRSGPFGACGDLEQPVRDGPSSISWLATGTAWPSRPSCPGHGRVLPLRQACLWHLYGPCGAVGPGATRTILSSSSSMTCQTPGKKKSLSPRYADCLSESVWLEHSKTKRTYVRESAFLVSVSPRLRFVQGSVSLGRMSLDGRLTCPA